MKHLYRMRPAERAALLNLPDHMHAGIIRWVEQGIPPGDFLRAVIKNDLQNAVRRADSVNILCIPEYVKFFYNHTPALCWGSPKNFESWAAAGRKLREPENAG